MLLTQTTSLTTIAVIAISFASITSALRWRNRRRRLVRRNICGRATQPVRTAGGYDALIGNTPMIRLSSLSNATGCEVLVKVEYLNPGGTSKDRIAKNMILEAERSGRLRPGGTVVEGTSGSTGISLASLCRAKGYRCVIVMPDDQAKEKVDLLRTFGAMVEQVRTASIASPNHYINLAERWAAELPGAVFMDQFETGANFRAHYYGSGPEIFEQTEGRVDAFVMGAGTGGCIAGVSRYLKEKATTIKAFLVDPPGSGLYNRVLHGVCYSSQMSEKDVKRHRYDTIAEGIGNDHITANFALAQLDGAFRVSDQEAVDMAHYLLQEEGLFVGCSSAMNCVGAVLAARQLGPGHTVVTMLCDSGTRSISRFWNKEYIESRGLRWPPSLEGGDENSVGKGSCVKPGAEVGEADEEEKEGLLEESGAGNVKSLRGECNLEFIVCRE